MLEEHLFAAFSKFMPACHIRLFTTLIPKDKSSCIISRSLTGKHLQPLSDLSLPVPARPDWWSDWSAAPRPLCAIILRRGHTTERRSIHKCEGCVAGAGASSAESFWQTGFRVQTVGGVQLWSRGCDQTIEEDFKLKETQDSLYLKSVPIQHLRGCGRLLCSFCPSHWTGFPSGV